MLATGAHARGRIFGHTRNINLQLEQSVDGINIAHRSEACSARLDDLTHDTTNPPHPQLNVGPGNIYSIREGSPRRANSTLHLGVRGKTTCKIDLGQPNGALQNSGQYFFHQQYKPDRLLVDEKRTSYINYLIRLDAAFTFRIQFLRVPPLAPSGGPESWSLRGLGRTHGWGRGPSELDKTHDVSFSLYSCMTT